MRWKADKLIVGKRGKGAYVGDESILFKSYSPDNQKRIRERLTLDDNKWADPMAGLCQADSNSMQIGIICYRSLLQELELNKN